MNFKHRQFFLIFAVFLIAFSLLGINFLYLSQNWGPAFYGKSRFVDRNGDPVGGDFITFYAASSLALAGQDVQIYDPARLQTEIEKVLGKKINYVWWYPPTFLLVVLPLAQAPYFTSLLLWLSITLLCYLAVLLCIAPHALTVLLALAFPGTFINIACGQNAFLSAVLLGGGLLLIDKFPRAGGLFLGLMSYKPHIAILIPLALAAGRRWQALGFFFLSALGLILASIMVLGYEPWLVFLTNFLRPAYALQKGAWPWEKMPTVFATVFLLGGNLLTARLFQGLVSIGVAAVVAWIWHKNAPSYLRNAALVLSVLLFTPYAFYYDLALLALPLAWLTWEGCQKGWLPGEGISLILAGLAPFFTYCLTTLFSVSLPLTPLMIGLLFLLCLRRTYRQPTFSAEE